MKVKTILCVTVVSLITLCSRPANGSDRQIRGYVRPPNRLSPFGVRGKTPQYIPVPIVKKVTHHHVHHVIPLQKTEHKKYAFEENEAFNGGAIISNVGLSKEGNQYEGGLGKGPFNVVNKRGGRFGGDLKTSENSTDGLNGGNAGSGQGFGGIGGLIGDTKAEFVPVVIGLLDEEENQQKSDGGSYSLRGGADGYGFDSGSHGFDDGKHGFDNGRHGFDDGKHGFDSGRHGFDDGKHGFENGRHGFDNGRHGFDNGRHGFDDGKHGFDNGRHAFDNGRYGSRNQNFADSNRGANNKEYSSRKGLLMPYNSRREYIPPPETMKLFEELARYGW